MRLLRVGDRLSALRVRIEEKFTLPERFKGTVVEKWTNYWKGLLRDYGEVGAGVVKESYANPKKALAYGTGVLTLYLAARNNPDEAAFMTLLRKQTNRMVTLPPDQQNPDSANYLTMLERAVNQKKLRLLSLGICTLMWVDLYDEDDCTYPAVCEYTSVGLLNFHQRIIDVGCWNEFWRLKHKMRNYDINYL
ncbi:mitochondrial import inner membrane translocase subunit Tim29 [Drosophila sulfurigaster albostrigata]|uniref:Mitochondrial import inner membrane translocase subunit Tim29 n=1 Tax=Drosophila albomicans TaxID=7291 RepID=A0A6P8Y0D7_DROAB|nr:mitochondrial import inner membrane translocase subunit Tim29 [Drosophila albomicans]XP_060664350.1 mitochondrial import inner membrane translocase subunit Tim29 [Drosophila nasuta]XP_062140961.1 mitochondrial import inner membrane translocase subunit Tim29 [Drosophila sulfurigaster albostrigata]